MSTLKVNDVLNESISQVLAICPDVDIRSVKLDLTLTGNAEQTINRILDGTNLTASGEELSSTDINSDSSLDLPIIHTKSTTSKLVENTQLKSLKLTVEKICAFESDSDTELPDLDVNPSTSNVIDNTAKTCLTVHKDTESVSTPSKSDIALSLPQQHSNLGDRIKMNSEDDNYDIVSYPTQNFIKRNTDTCFSSDSGDDDLPDLDLPDLDLPCLAERFKMKSPRSVLSDLDSNISKASDYDSSSTLVSERSTTSNMSEMSDVLAGNKKGKKKRTQEEVAQSKRQAMLKKEEKMREKEEKKAQKEREAQLKKMESENKKAFRPGDCLKKITVSIDPGIINTGGVGGLVFKVCEDLSVKCETVPQTIPNSVLWKREVIECTPEHVFLKEKGETDHELFVRFIEWMTEFQASIQPQGLPDLLLIWLSMPDMIDKPSGRVKQVTEEDIIIMVPLQDFISMVKSNSQKQKGDNSAGVTFTEFIQSLQCSFSNHLFTFFVHGLDRYFSDLKLIRKQKHKEAVLETGVEGGKVKKRKMAVDTVITQIELEEAMVESQLLTGCIIKYLDTNPQIADLIRTFTKAVAEKPAKKGRLENVFNFLEEGTAGVKVDKNGQGLLKVFKHQLMQFKNLGQDMADAILGVYPSPRLLLQGYSQCSSEKEKEKLLENIMVRRGGGVLATNRRVGKEMSRRIYLFFTTHDPNFVIK